jgi:hypothetical protein
MRNRPAQPSLFFVPILLALLAGPASAEEEIAILPSAFTLAGPASSQELLVEAASGGRYRGQLTEGVSFETSDPEVVVVRGGRAIPTGNGSARITARAGGRTAIAEVSVEVMDAPFRWSFRNHVLSVLTKAGCNSGACHGAVAGKNGFKLSLRGYDPTGDFLSLTRHARGRRIAPADPGRSLVLTKPTGAIPHKGGKRFDIDSLEYRVIAEWIAAGTTPPLPEDPEIVRLEVLPERVLLAPGAVQKLVVRAHFSDGRAEDVTRWAKFEGTNASVAQVGDDGLVTVMGHGEGAVTAWYLSRIAVAVITVPQAQAVAPELFAELFRKAERRNFIDEIILRKLEDLNIPPSPPASDGEFIRRAFIDTIGVLPSSAETRAFLAGGSPGKRDRLIEALLERPEFVDYWAYKWSDLLLVNSEKLRPAAMWAYYDWIRNNVAANTPWDKLARNLVTAQGSTLENGATNFFVLHPDPPAMAETTSLAFLGMSVNCARCHNHPLEKWTNGQYYGMVNLFARVRAKDAAGDGNKIVFSAPSGDVVQPLTGRPQPPRPLDGEALPLDLPGDRRPHLADWLTSPENPYFSRAIANRVWANFLGVGLVENVDDLRLTNPASNEELLAALARHLVESGFDLKALMRSILQSATYQRSSVPLPENAADGRFYSRYYPRRLKAEVLLDALSQATGAPSQFPGYPEGWRALQLPDSNVSSYFLKSFGRPDRLITCECERTDEPSMAQALHISNGDTLNQKLAAAGNRIEKLLAGGASGEEIIEELYLSALSRRPSASEKEQLLALLAEAGEEHRRQAIEDLFWSVLSSKEFLFNS